MDTFEAIRRRRSIRRFRPEPVSDAALEQLLAAAMSAPSAGNEQPWEFVVVRAADVRAALAQAHPYAAMVREAPVGVVVCADLARVRHAGFWEQDCAAATENLLLAATALGLGAVWCGVHPREERVRGLRRVLALPEPIVPFALVPVGHPGEEKPPAERHDPARIHHDRW